MKKNTPAYGASMVCLLSLSSVAQNGCAVQEQERVQDAKVHHRTLEQDVLVKTGLYASFDVSSIDPVIHVEIEDTCRSRYVSVMEVTTVTERKVAEGTTKALIGGAGIFGTPGLLMLAGSALDEGTPSQDDQAASDKEASRKVGLTCLGGGAVFLVILGINALRSIDGENKSMETRVDRWMEEPCQRRTLANADVALRWLGPAGGELLLTTDSGGILRPPTETLAGWLTSDVSNVVPRVQINHGDIVSAPMDLPQAFVAGLERERVEARRPAIRSMLAEAERASAARDVERESYLIAKAMALSAKDSLVMKEVIEVKEYLHCNTMDLDDAASAHERLLDNPPSSDSARVRKCYEHGLASTKAAWDRYQAEQRMEAAIEEVEAELQEVDGKSLAYVVREEFFQREPCTRMSLNPSQRANFKMKHCSAWKTALGRKGRSVREAVIARFCNRKFQSPGSWSPPPTFWHRTCGLSGFVIPVENCQRHLEAMCRW